MTGVCLVAADAPGGIRTYTAMIVEALAMRLPRRPVHRLDSRGPSVWLSPAFCLAVALRLIALRAGGRVDTLHLMASERMSLWRKAFLAVIGRILGLGVIVHHHGAEMPSLALRGGLNRFAVGMIGRLAHRHLVLGEAWREALVAAGVPPGRISLLRNALPDRPPPDRETDVHRLRLLFLGELSERKGVPVLMDALEKLRGRVPDIELAVAGDGPMREALARFSGRSHAPILLHGQVGPDAARDLMETSDLLVHPSLNEGLPMTLLEAMRAGLPTIATPVGAIAEAIPDGAGVAHVLPGDADALASAIERLAHDHHARRRLGEAGRKTFERRFRLEEHIDRLVHFYGWDAPRPAAEGDGAVATERAA